MSPATLAVVAHTLVVLCLLGAYTALSLAGVDATALLGLLGGYVGGAATQAGIDKTGAQGGE